MQTLSSKINGIELKLRQLALKLERLQNENTDILEENKQLKAELLKKPSAGANRELKTVQTVIEVEKEKNPASIKKRRKEIDQYIKEIDKCIEWLSNS